MSYHELISLAFELTPEDPWNALEPIDLLYLDITFANPNFDYPGHDLLNLRAAFDAMDRLTITARLNNIADRAMADRADYAFGNYRYFPGRGRELFVEFRYRF